MKQLTLPESLETFRALMQSARHTMFKAEVLQDYSAVDDCPSLRAWMAGDKERARALGRVDKGIIDYRNQCLASPAEIIRVHVVKKPYTPYIEWETAVCYQDSLLAYKAEKIFFVPFEKIRGIQLPAGDFWIFDDMRVLQWEYENGIGMTSGARFWDEAQGHDVSHFRQIRDALLDLAIAEPLQDLLD